MSFSEDSLLVEAWRVQPKVVSIRRTIHQNPELGRNEYHTQELVFKSLANMGIRARAAAGTGVIAEICGTHDGPTIALRADMDALPIEERTNLAYASLRQGVMHACGHDMHTAALLGAAMLLCRHREEICGKVRLLFQPDEENDGGAERMVADGAMDDVSAVFGMHVNPELPVGTIGVRSGAAYAASNPFDVVFRGVSAHGAEPHLGHDVLPATCAFVESAQLLSSRMTSPLAPVVITIGSMHAGTARNVLAQEATLNGIIRCYGEEMRAALTKEITRLAVSIAKAHRVQADVRVIHGYDGVWNDEKKTRFIADTARRLLGETNVHHYSETLTTEDFGAYLKCAPGSFWHLGVAESSRQSYPLHNPCFNPDERALPVAVALHACAALKYLSGK